MKGLALRLAVRPDSLCHRITSINTQPIAKPTSWSGSYADSQSGSE
jgi:hypothetical protein